MSHANGLDLILNENFPIGPDWKRLLWYCLWNSTVSLPMVLAFQLAAVSLFYEINSVTKLLKIPPCSVLTRVSASNTLTRTHHLFLVLFLFFLMFLVVALFYFDFFFFLFFFLEYWIHLGFNHAACTSRQLNTQTVFQSKHPV